MTADIMTSVSSILLSLIFSYIPGTHAWFAKQSGVIKRLVILVSLFLIALATYVLSCSNLAEGFGITIPCTTNGLQGLLRSFVLALVINQSVYLITPNVKPE